MGYVGMLYAIVEHYFVDGALHVCQTGGVCEAAKEYTCDECIKGLEWVEAYIEDPIMIAEFTIYLEQNYCLSKSFFRIKNDISLSVRTSFSFLQATGTIASSLWR